MSKERNKASTLARECVDGPTALAPERFISNYLVGNRPVVVSGAMRSWAALTTVTIDWLVREFGNLKAQVYDDLFGLVNVERFDRYAAKHLVSEQRLPRGQPQPYVRWYTQFRPVETFPWADPIFASIADGWDMPSFMPRSGYVLPGTGGREVTPARDRFPARGLFISPPGARTRLHSDPWASDAVLCQIQGRKRVVMFEPAVGAVLSDGAGFADLDAPDRLRFPRFDDAYPSADFVLDPGEIAFVPSGWLHHVETLEPSVSLTWNFVHGSTRSRFGDYLLAGITPAEREVIDYFVASGTDPTCGVGAT